MKEEKYSSFRKLAKYASNSAENLDFQIIRTHNEAVSAQISDQIVNFSWIFSVQMNLSDRVAYYVTSCSVTALAFLSFVGLYSAPAQCPKCGEADNWYIHQPKEAKPGKTTKSGEQPYWWCRQSREADPAPPKAKASSRKKKKAGSTMKMCSHKRVWKNTKHREDFPSADKLPKILPHKLLKILWNFSQMFTQEYSIWDTGLSRDTVGSIYYMLRDSLGCFMTKVQGQRKIGGRGKVVCLDETFFCKKPKNKSGFRGKTRLSHQTIFMGGVELDGTGPGRKCTGRAFLVLIKNRRAETFKQVIEDYVEEVLYGS